MYKYLQKLKRIIVITLYNCFCIFKVNNKKIVLYSPSKNYLSGNLLEIKKVIKNRKVKIFYQNKKMISFLYSLATAKIIITDDYAPLIYPLKIRKNVKFIQVWHASGAFKRVGFERPSANKNSITHKNYTDVIVSSTNIIDDYSKSFGIDKDKIKPLGTIKTDMFFDKDKVDFLKEQFKSKYQIFNKKIILYAPTFRGKGIKSAYYSDALDLDSLLTRLGDDYVILFRNHPFVKRQKDLTSKNIIDISCEKNIDDILPCIDLLITDYSSIIFDAMLLHKPVIFYVPDLEEYKEDRGFYYDFEDYNYGKIVYTSDELIVAIQRKEINDKKIKELKSKHLNMCDGKSLERFVKMYLD